MRCLLGPNREREGGVCMLRLISNIFSGVFAFILVLVVCSFLGTLFYGLFFGRSEMELSIHHSSMTVPLLHWRNFGSFVGAGIGSLIGLGILISLIKRSRDISWLERYGQRIAATITEIESYAHHSTSTSSSGG